MLRKIMLAVLVAIIVYIACIGIGMLLGAMNVAIAATVGAFITRFATAIAIIAGLWYYFAGAGNPFKTG